MIVNRRERQLKITEEGRQRDKAALQTMKTRVQSMEQAMNRKFSQTVEYISCIRSMEKRIEFATERMKVLKGLFERKEKKYLEKIQKLQDTIRAIEQREKDVLEEQRMKIDRANQSMIESLEREVLSLTHDRELLLEKTKQDADQYGSKLSEVTQQYEKKISETHENVRDLEQRVRTLRQEQQRRIDFEENIEERLRHAFSLFKEEAIRDKEHAVQFLSQKHAADMERAQSQHTLTKNELADMKRKLSYLQERDDVIQKSSDTFDEVELLETKLSAKETELRTMRNERDLLLARLRKQENDDTLYRFESPVIVFDHASENASRGGTLPSATKTNEAIGHPQTTEKPLNPFATSFYNQAMSSTLGSQRHPALSPALSVTPAEREQILQTLNGISQKVERLMNDDD